MKTFLILYIILINLTGFVLMGIDKRRAIRRKWRIPERRLFAVALLFGSVGILTGMYVFRHKTKHLSFAIGIPAILVVQLLALSFLYSWNHQRMGSPSQVVERELSLISDLDSDTIQSFVSYENLTNPHLASGTIGDETAEAVDLFFQHFTYHIHNEQIEGDEATVSVNITNIDTRALAHDLCMQLHRDSAVLFPDAAASSTTDYYRLLRDTLSSNAYEETVTTAYFHLKKEEAGWTILADRQLEDELVSGFISYMNDPHILSAADVLSIHLDALGVLTDEQWAEYLDIEDVFATYNTDYYQAIDAEYVRQLADAYGYEILRCDEDGDTATAVVRVTSTDMTEVLSAYKEHLLAYAATTRSIRDDDVAVSNETARLLLQSLEDNTQTDATDVELTFRNNGETWEVYFNTEFTNALMGDISGAIETFNSITHEPAPEIVNPA